MFLCSVCIVIYIVSDWWRVLCAQIGLIHTKVLILEYLNQHNGEKWYGYNHANDSLTWTSNWQSLYTDE